MSRSKSPTLSHRIEYLAYRGMEAALRTLSLETTFKLGELTGRVIFRLLPGMRTKVIRNLRFAFGGEKSRSNIEDLAARVFERTGANLFSSIRLPFLSDEEISRHLTIEGLKEIIETSGSKGIVAISPHMGNWELLAQAAYLVRGSFETGTHYRPLNNRLLNHLVERRRKRRGLKLFAKSSSGHAMASFVKKGGFLAILADQRVGSRGFPGVFFGRATTCSSLPDLMARRGQGRLMRLLCETTGTARWRISLTEVPEISPQACATSLEEAWRRSPEDVFWFGERWRLQGANHLRFLEKYGPNHQVTRPLRIINLTSSAPPLPIAPSLATQEKHPLDLSQPDHHIRHELALISDEGDSPVDFFLAPASQRRRLAGLSDKILVISPDQH